jgi:hypothetical protein
MNTWQGLCAAALLVSVGASPPEPVPQSAWAGPDALMGWLAFPDGIPGGGLTGIEPRNDGGRHYLRISWKALNSFPVIAIPNLVDPTLEKLATLPAVLDPREHDALRLTVRHTTSFDAIVARWVHRSVQLEELEAGGPIAASSPLPGDGEWRDVVVRLSDSPYFMAEDDIVYLEWALAPVDLEDARDLPKRFESMSSDAYLDIERIAFLRTGDLPAPFITDFTPRRGGRKTMVKISGGGFAIPVEKNIVEFRGTPARVVSGDETLLVVEANGFGEAPISVRVPGGRVATSEAPFTFLGSPRTFAVAGGDHQSGPIGAILEPLVVRVADMRGQGLPGHEVTWEIASGKAGISESEVVTDSDGKASAVVTLGATAGQVSVTATTYGFRPVTFSVTALPERP